MKLGHLGRITADLKLEAFVAEHAFPALIFLTEIARPTRALTEELLTKTVVDSEATAPTRRVDRGDKERAARVSSESLVLVLKPRLDPAAGVSIGRAPGNDYAVPRPSISKSHATFSPTERGWKITDLASSNGTYVNGQCLPSGGSADLTDGALIGFGEAQAKFFSPQALYGIATLFRFADDGA